MNAFILTLPLAVVGWKLAAAAVFGLMLLVLLLIFFTYIGLFVKSGLPAQRLAFRH